MWRGSIAIDDGGGEVDHGGEAVIGFVGAHDDALELLELALESCRTRRSVRARRIRLGSGQADPATRDSRQGSLDTQSSRPVTEGPL